MEQSFDSLSYLKKFELKTILNDIDQFDSRFKNINSCLEKKIKNFDHSSEKSCLIFDIFKYLKEEFTDFQSKVFLFNKS